jgi:hypothetical protein
MPALFKRFFWLSCCLFALAAPSAHALVVDYKLADVVLEDRSQLTGAFSWTYTAGSFLDGSGRFTSLSIPYTSHDHTDLDATIDVGESIEITLVGSTHDDGVDITFVLAQPLTPTSGSAIDLSLSKYEIGGNGFHDGLFLSGRVTPVAVPEPGAHSMLLAGLVAFGALGLRRHSRG